MAHSQMSEEAPAKASIWRDPQKRALLFQVIVLAAVFAFIAYIFNNTLENLERRGISTGFAEPH